jgi:hypothetical protein
MHVAQQTPQVTVDVFDLLQLRAREDELHKRVLHQIFGSLALLMSQLHGPREQSFVTLRKELFTSRFWLDRGAALIEHFDSGLHEKSSTFIPTRNNVLSIYMTVYLRVISNTK